jgi:hypothetical protein
MSDHLSTQRGNPHKRTHEQAEELPQHGTSLADFYGQGPQANVMRLQTTIGNKATQRLLDTRNVQRVVITDPAKLKAAKAKYQAAILNHAKDKGALVKAVEDGLKLRSTDRRLANSCEWVKVAKKAKLYAVTTTGDSDERITEAGMDDSKDMALFPNGLDKADNHIYGATSATYKYDDLSDNTGVDLDPDGKVTGGWNIPGIITIYNARNVSTETVWSTLRHEVQHDADHNDDKTAAAGSVMEENFEGYKTEYRAYHYQQTDYEGLSMTTDVNKYGYTWKEKQLAIFEHIFDGYQHTQDFWDDSAPSNTPSTKDAPNDNTIGDPAKQAIAARQARLVAYVNPDTQGFNKWNSVRVEDFYQALKAVPNGTGDEKAATVVELLNKCKPLKMEDQRYIRAESPDFETMLTTKLTGKAKTAVYDAIGKK